MLASLGDQRPQWKCHLILKADELWLLARWPREGVLAWSRCGLLCGHGLSAHNGLSTGDTAFSVPCFVCECRRGPPTPTSLICRCPVTSVSLPPSHPQPSSRPFVVLKIYP